MHFTYALAAALLAGQAYASTVNILPRQTPDQLASMIPPACAATCQPLTSLQQECASASDPMSCVCKPTTAKAMEDCTTCAVKELLAQAETAGIDPATIQAGVDAAKQTLTDMCKGAGTGAGGSSGGSSSSGTTAGSGSSAGSTTSPAAGSASTTGAPQANATNSLGNGNSGVRVEFAGSAILAVAGVVGAFLL